MPSILLVNTTETEFAERALHMARIMVKECRFMKRRERDDWRKLIERFERGCGKPEHRWCHRAWRDYAANRVERIQAIMETNMKVTLVRHLQRKGLLPKDCEVAK